MMSTTLSRDDESRDDPDRLCVAVDEALVILLRAGSFLFGAVYRRNARGALSGPAIHAKEWACLSLVNSKQPTYLVPDGPSFSFATSSIEILSPHTQPTRALKISHSLVSKHSTAGASHLISSQAASKKLTRVPRRQSMGLKKTKSAAKKKKPTDFGAALAKARQETDHIFKQASQEEEENSSSAATASNHFDEEKISPRSKAAAWAWYQRGGGNDSNGSPEDVRNRAMVVVQRTSRFKAEALRVNGSYTAGDTIVKAHQKWDPSHSLFDSFELLSVAKELDKALQEASAASIANSRNTLVSLNCSSSSPLPRKSGAGNGSGSGSGRSRQLAARLSRFIPTPVLCLSEEDIATAHRSFKKSKSSSSVSSTGSAISSSESSSGKSNWLSCKFSNLLTYNLSNLSNLVTANDEEDDDELYHHRHEHFHHHHHHHHHHLRR